MTLFIVVQRIRTPVDPRSTWTLSHTEGFAGEMHFTFQICGVDICCYRRLSDLDI